MAKDPRRKVALKIERGRREAAEAYMQGSKVGEDAEPKKSSKQKAIPMVEFMAEDCTIDNKEGVEVVDVLAIQRRCQGLGHHQSAPGSGGACWFLAGEPEIPDFTHCHTIKVWRDHYKGMEWLREWRTKDFAESQAASPP
eukprot:s9118_g1.t1